MREVTKQTASAVLGRFKRAVAEVRAQGAIRGSRPSSIRGERPPGKALGRFRLGSSQQPNITALSVPAGPRNDALFVASTTAPPTFVFRPGATFPNNGPVQQNVYTSGNSAGADGLAVLQGVLNGSGLFPAIPLPSSVVECDFSLEGTVFALPGDVNFGQNCSLKGLNFTDVTIQPTVLENATFTISGVVSIENMGFDITSVALLPSDTTYFKLGNNSFAQSIDNSGLLASVSAADLYLDVEGSNSSIGDGTHVTLFVSGHALSISLYGSPGAAGLGNVVQIADHALSGDGTGTLAIFLGSPSCQVDPSVWQIGTSGDFATVTFTFGYEPTPFVTFRPTGPNGPGVFTDLGQLSAYATAAANATSITQWAVAVDASLAGDVVALTSNTVLPEATTLTGLFDEENDVYPTLQTSGFTFAGLVAIENVTIQVSEATAIPIANASGIYDLSGQTQITSTDGNVFIDLPVVGLEGSTAIVNAYGFNVSLGDGTQPIAHVSNGSTLVINIFGRMVLANQAVLIDAGGGLVLNVIGGTGSGIDPSFFGMTGVTINYADEQSLPSTEDAVTLPSLNDDVTTFEQLFPMLVAKGASVYEIVLTDDIALGTGASAVDGSLGGAYSIRGSRAANNVGYIMMDGGAGGNYLSQPSSIQDVTFQANTEPILIPNNGVTIILDGCINISSVPFVSVSTGNGLQVILRGGRYVTSPAFAVADGARLYLYLYSAATYSGTLGNGSLQFGADSIQLTGSATCTIYISSPNIELDPTLYSMAGVTVVQEYTPVALNVPHGATATVLSQQTGSYRADSTAGPVAFALPPTGTVLLPLLPDGYKVRTTLANGVVAGGGFPQLVNNMSVTVDGGAGEKLVSPDNTGALETTWNTTAEGNLLGTSVEWEWYAIGNYWLNHG